MKPHYWQLSYDITDAKRLRRVAKLALVNGERVQKSLYLLALTPEQLARLHQQLGDIIEAPDRLLLRPVCSRCRSRTRYQGKCDHVERHEPFWIL